MKARGQRGHVGRGGGGKNGPGCRHALSSPAAARLPSAEETEPDWTRKCEVCGEVPIMPATGMCGPCTFGDADTAGGNW